MSEERRLVEISAELKKIVAELKKMTSGRDSSAPRTMRPESRANRDLNPVELLEQELEVRNRIGGATGDAMQQQQQLIQYERDRLRIAERRFEQAVKLHVQLGENSEITEEDLEYVEEILELLRESVTEEEAKLDAMQQQQKTLEGIKRHTTDIVADFRNAASSVVDLGRSLGSAIKSGASLADIAGEMGKGAVVGSMKLLIGATKELAMEQDKAFSDYLKITGASKEYESVLSDVYKENKQFGISQTEAAVAMATLSRNMTQFSGLSERAQKDLGGFVAKLNEAGISGEIAVRTMELLTVNLGKSLKEAKAFADEMTQLGAVLGNPEKALREFNKAAAVLMSHGSETDDIFRDLAFSAHALGLEVQDLVDISMGFETFEDAARGASELNYILGGNMVNSLELLSASGEDVIRMLIQTFEQSGQSWDAMNRFEKGAVASAAGITDMAQANAIFGKSLSAYDESIRLAEEDAKKKAIATKRTEEFQTMQEELQTLFMEFAFSIRPVVNAFKDLLRATIELFNKYEWLAPTIAGLVSVFGAVAVAAKVVGAGLSIAATASALLGSTAAPASAGMGALGKAGSSAGKGLAKAAPGILAFGAAVLMAGGGIALVALSFSHLAGHLDKISEHLMTLAALTLGIVVLAAAAAAAGDKMLLLGGGIALVGVGVAMAAASMSLLATAMTGLFSFMVENVDVLGTVSVHLASINLQIVALAAALGTIGLAGAAAGFGIASLAGGFVALSGVLMTIKTADLRAVATISSSLAALGEASITYSDIGSGLSDMVGAFEEIAGIKGSVIRFAAAVDMENTLGQFHELASILATIAQGAASFKQAMESISASTIQISEERTNRIERVAEATRKIIWSATLGKVTGADDVLEELAKYTGGGQGAASAAAPAEGGGGGRQPVVLEVDGRVFAREVKRAINSEKRKVGTGVR